MRKEYVRHRRDQRRREKRVTRMLEIAIATMFFALKGATDIVRVVGYVLRSGR